MDTQHTRRAVALFSGGLDSILAAKLLQEQGMEVSCLHFTTPFFGKAAKIAHWSAMYGLSIEAVDISEEFAAMLANRPVYGFGSVLNPCVDCKILMLRRARIVMEERGACCIASGEVLGQRPMSQRRDTLNVIARDAGVKGLLLRPLCARHLDPTQAELDGLVDRGRLLGITGRGRKEQMALAKHFALMEIPTPAGGCRLAEQENARSYWPILRSAPKPSAADFLLANAGRQYWLHAAGGQSPHSPAFWLTIGRNQTDNDAIMRLAGEADLLFKVRDFPGPIALGRFLGQEWYRKTVHAAASFVASYSPKAMQHAAGTRQPLPVRVHKGSLDAPGGEVLVLPAREPAPGEPVWREYSWLAAHEEIRAEARECAGS